ncbi:MAG: hypothetical protein N4J56_001708 [Chroococcidiopsis sp. SAG 2025]|uniref:calcium-binding protein n=1 Tax=Chroococcidiopsis sp. SAG 2025 TaxID=171389 RepID=UPI002937054A|nr:calcium-binding protein [Chroococcidiopsis sp. SAG 2025]MDV2992054.1 hypothetical protein [Chroococcidiopsis sp. SAG 2025]
MSELEIDASREERIDMEVVVDAYDEEERRLGWYYYLDNKVNFPFNAIWISEERPIDSEDEIEIEGEEVEVIGMASEEECQDDMYVEIVYQEEGTEDTFAVPLYDVVPMEVDDDTLEAIEDWYYWVERGYEW